ncbi:hypothetical protein FSARC_12654 [Fusarium sarcochroum]|uniref:Uncharacterized protein n=1 Tax=Fusarium sarcochroum TaxID=1208366 RepID=A0A8H4WVY7_9HYPO|nr:hypothetical protein FSARC_12654 [Fusarium sarcochroum]
MQDDTLHRRSRRDTIKTQNTTWLNTHWNGPHWIPADVRAGLNQVGMTDPGDNTIHFLRKISEVAISAQVPLQSLWSATGPLRIAVDHAQAEKNARLAPKRTPHLPHLTGKIASEVYTTLLREYPAVEPRVTLSAVARSPSPEPSLFANRINDFADSDDESAPNSTIGPAQSPVPTLSSDATFFTSRATPELPDDMDQLSNPESHVAPDPKKRKLTTLNLSTEMSDKIEGRRHGYVQSGLATAKSREEMQEVHLQSSAQVQSAESSKNDAEKEVASFRAKVEASMEMATAANLRVQECVERLNRNPAARRDSALGDMETDNYADMMDNEMFLSGRSYIKALKDSTTLHVTSQKEYTNKLAAAQEKQKDTENQVHAAQVKTDALKTLIDEITGIQDATGEVAQAEEEVVRLEEKLRKAVERAAELRQTQRDKISDMVKNDDWDAKAQNMENLGWDKYVEVHDE